MLECGPLLSVLHRYTVLCIFSVCMYDNMKNEYEMEKNIALQHHLRATGGGTIWIWFEMVEGIA